MILDLKCAWQRNENNVREMKYLGIKHLWLKRSKKLVESSNALLMNCPVLQFTKVFKRPKVRIVDGFNYSGRQAKLFSFLYTRIFPHFFPAKFWLRRRVIIILLPVCLSLCLSLHLSTKGSIYLAIPLSLCLSVSPSNSHYYVCLCFSCHVISETTIR